MKRFFLLFLLLFSVEAKKALITGITGQDGAYLAEFLIKKGYEVHGLIRRSSLENHGDIDSQYRRLGIANDGKCYLHYGDLTDSSVLHKLISTIQPDEIYNLAAQSHVHISFEVPRYTTEVDAFGPFYILESIRLSGLADKTKFYQASTSELYGDVLEIPQKETTPFNPRSPYAIAKELAYWITRYYRETYGMFASNGILFNHESPRRGKIFVTRKITTGVARIQAGIQKTLKLGNLNATRDWGFAGDYVEAMWEILQHSNPDDFVIATGKSYSVRKCVEVAFARIGKKIIWQGEGLSEIGIDEATGEVMVEVDPQYYRPAEVHNLKGNPSKAQDVLGWKPKVNFKELIEMMVDNDIMVKENIKE